jgi:hypothetical protein
MIPAAPRGSSLKIAKAIFHPYNPGEAIRCALANDTRPHQRAEAHRHSKIEKNRKGMERADAITKVAKSSNQAAAEVLQCVVQVPI